jgi:diguanylate cyclase (GGDEF)-like protein
MELDRTSAYRGADLPRARRFSKLVWAAGNALVFALVPFYPPTAALGADGWWLCAACAPLIVAASVIVTRPNVGWRGLLFVTYAGLAVVTVLQLLAGHDAPYAVVDLLLVCCVALVHPLGVALPFAASMVATRVGIALLQNEPGGLAHALAESAVWTLLAAVLCGVMKETREQRLQLRDERSFDPLTGLPNRRSFDEELAAQLAKGTTPLSLIVADVNGFKQLNDRHGHVEGDAQLVKVARALAAGLRPGDLCFRWGGDEFAVLLPGSDYAAARVVADRLAVLVAAACSEPEELTICTGHAQWAADEDLLSLVTRADRMLLERKRSLYEPVMRVPAGAAALTV